MTGDGLIRASDRVQQAMEDLCYFPHQLPPLPQSYFNVPARNRQVMENQQIFAQKSVSFLFIMGHCFTL